MQRHRPIAGRVKTISIKREGGAWYVIVSGDDVPTHPLAQTGRADGVDVGVTEFAALADGTVISRKPRPGGSRLKTSSPPRSGHIACDIRRHAPRSQRKTRSAQAVAQIHRGTACKRLDFHHTATVRGFDLIAHEQLSIAGMTRAPRPKPDPDSPDAFLPNGPPPGRAQQTHPRCCLAESPYDHCRE